MDGGSEVRHREYEKKGVKKRRKGKKEIKMGVESEGEEREK